MKKLDKIAVFISQNYKNNFMSLTTNEINSIINISDLLVPKKVYDVKYLGLYEDLYAKYSVIIKNEESYFISKLCFGEYPPSGVFVMAYEEFYDKDSRNKFKSLDDARKVF